MRTLGKSVIRYQCNAMILRSLAKRGELLPIYNKAREKTMELEKLKKEKKAAA